MKKFGLICFALVIALGTVGVGYAMWTDTIYIDGTVKTGEVCIAFTCPVGSEDTDVPSPPYTLEEGADPDDFDWNAISTGPGFHLFPVRMGKNVGWTEIECVYPEPGVGPDTISVNLYNVYPSYWNHIVFGVYNCGTIPVILDHVIFRDAAGNVLATLYDDGYVSFNMGGGTTHDIEIQWGDNFGNQLEPGYDTWNISFWIHVMQDEEVDFSVPQNWSFSVEIVAVQWNEFVPH